MITTYAYDNLRLKQGRSNGVAFQTSSYDWDYLIEPQGNTMAGISDRRPKWYAGKVLGGSSMLNAMLYLRGHRDDYDEWESMGCDGWGYDDVLPYFKKSEGFQPGFSDDAEVHGKKGPLKVHTFDLRQIDLR